jgi:S1-C subfamily serine protease
MRAAMPWRTIAAIVPFKPSPMNSEAAVHPQLPDAVARIAASVVGVVTRRQAATGVVWRDGLVVTSAAALWRASRVQLVLPGGEALEATLRGADAGTDLAVLSFTGARVPAAAGDTQAPRTSPRVGDFVFAAGREPEGGVHASFGHVGAVGGAWRSWRGGRFDELIRLDGGLYPGLAGAAVAGLAGPVLGIASPVFSRHHAVVVPSATIERVLTALLEHGRVPRAHLGIAVQPVRATLDGVAVEGLLVTSVAEGGPAAQGGLLVGDTIVEAAGQPVRQLEALRTAIAEAAPGSTLALVVARAGQRVQLALTAAEKPASGCH